MEAASVFNKNHFEVQKLCFLRKNFEIFTIAIVLLLCCITAGCTPDDGFRKYAGAVGPDLYSRQTLKNTSLLSAYTANLCQQADLGIDTYGRCAITTVAGWKEFVDMGLYDIDQRCDSFLDSLYYKDKTGDSIIAQISDTRSFTGTVLGATAASNRAIRIVAAAFDFAESSFRNTNNTLLDALDPTTVKSIVFRRQQQIKEQIYSAPISSKPQALHALRTYLRVCMPFTIEMEANAVLTTAQRTNTTGESPILFADTAKTSETIPNRNGGHVPPKSSQDAIALFGPDSGRGENSVKKVQKKLCVAETGNVGPITRTAVGIYRQSNDDPDTSWRPLSKDDVQTILDKVPDCNEKIYLNYYETSLLGTAPGLEAFISAFNTKATGNELLTANDKLSSDANSSFRQKISALKLRRPELAPQFEDGNFGHVTKVFYTNLQRSN